MTIADWLKEAQKQLDAAGIGTARLDALVMLEKITGLERTKLLAHDDRTISEHDREKLNAWLGRRLHHEPLTYIVGETEFYGRKFYVDDRVLVPRPESETMIELLSRYLSTSPGNSPVANDHIFDISDIIMLDMGTGSGALAITAKLLYPASVIYASDIDPNCLEVARQNAQNHNAAINFFGGDLLDANSPTPLQKRLDVILANLPYVPDDHTINQAALHEPKHAIFGGSDGLDLYRKLFQQAAARPPAEKPKLIFTESLPFQHAALKTIAETTGYQEKIEDDFIQLFELTSD